MLVSKIFPALFVVGTDSKVGEILKNIYQFIEACNNETAFQEWYQEIYDDIQQHLKDYIDLIKLMRD